MAAWSFLTNHALVLTYIDGHPESTGLQIAQAVGITERATRNLEAQPEMKAAIVTNPEIGSSPEFPGRVIAALANDPDIMERSGATYIAAELALYYGVTDVDGRVPPSLRAQRGSPLYSPV